jgi:hypothetical protein
MKLEATRKTRDNETILKQKIIAMSLSLGINIAGVRPTEVQDSLWEHAYQCMSHTH